MAEPVNLSDYLLPGLPAERIRARYAAAPGNEMASGKFASRESSAGLAANTFGYFLERPSELPRLPGTPDLGWPPLSVELEVENRFPWRGGRHPWLDAVVTTPTCLIGIESKCYEPFRTKKRDALSDAIGGRSGATRCPGSAACGTASGTAGCRSAISMRRSS